MTHWNNKILARATTVWSAVIAFSRLLYVWLAIIAYLLIWITFVVFSPSEITELQEVPLILQGGTDMGGSNIFAAYVAGYFLFGLLGCLLLTNLLRVSGRKSPRCWTNSWSTFTGLVLSYLVIISLPIITAIRLATFPTVDEGHHHAFFVCDDVTAAAVSFITYILSSLWIFWLSRKAISDNAKFLLSPLILVLSFYLASDGLTPKSGQVLNAFVIPKRQPVSAKHNIMLNVHDCCLLFTGWTEAP